MCVCDVILWPFYGNDVQIDTVIDILIYSLAKYLTSHFKKTLTCPYVFIMYLFIHVLPQPWWLTCNYWTCQSRVQLRTHSSAARNMPTIILRSPTSRPIRPLSSHSTSHFHKITCSVCSEPFHSFFFTIPNNASFVYQYISVLNSHVWR